MFTFQYWITWWAHGVTSHDLKQSNPLISALFVWIFQPTCHGLGATEGWLRRICVLLKCSQAMVVSEGGMSWGMSSEWKSREGGRRGDCGKGGTSGLVFFWRQLSRCCCEERWVITIKLLSRRKWPPIAPITVITADNTLDEETAIIFFLHLSSECYFFLQGSLCVVRALYWWLGLFLMARLRLRAEALSGECGCSLDVFTPTLAG